MDAFTFTLGRLSDAAIEDLAPDFETLAPNQYADGAYRLRRFSHFEFDRAEQRLTLLPPKDFVQGDDINHFQPGVARRYDDLLPTTWDTRGFGELIADFARLGALPELVRIEVHQLRVIARPGTAVETAPEGVHQDGFDRICIATIGRAHSTGADLSLHESGDAPALATLRQQAGQYVVLNDRTMWHSANPVVAVDAGLSGYWDAFVLTAHRA
ncbi:MAG TPA: 2OG-Fe dioxygenase family protein [Propioniciclava tarda]|nr:2OG-Fe dioxygenase family protein [Propioniciclava tarda]